MFPVQNYGRDFNESFVGMGNFVTGQKKADSDLDQRGIENSRADRTVAAQEASSKASVEHSTAQTAKIKREEDDAGLLHEAVPVYGKVANDEPLNDDDVKVLGRMRVKLPYLTNNIDDNRALQEAHSILIDANEKAKALPPSDKPFKFERGDSPELDKVLDAWNMVVSPARHKTHVDTSGAVTGTPGAEYSTDQIQAGAGISTEGGAKTAAYFSIVDANGAPIYQTDAQGNQVMRVVNGKAEPQRKLVAASVGQTNDPNAPVDFVPADALIMKSKLALEQLQAENKLPPELRTKLKKEIETNMYGLMPNGVEKLLASQVKDNTPIALADGGMLVDRTSGKVIAENAKAPGKGEHLKTEEGVKGRPGWVQDVYTDAGGKELRRGEPRLQFNPRPDNSGKSNKELERESRADIDKSAAELAKRRVLVNKNSAAANASGDPDAIREATRDADAYNAESASLTEKFEAHKREFGRSYTPTAVKPPARRGGGMAPVPAQAATPQKTAPPSNKATSAGKSKQQSEQLTSAQPIKSMPGKHLLTLSNGKRYIGSKGPKGWQLESEATIQ
jgi:hypothetical protein